MTFKKKLTIEKWGQAIQNFGREIMKRIKAFILLDLAIVWSPSVMGRRAELVKSSPDSKDGLRRNNFQSRSPPGSLSYINIAKKIRPLVQST